MTALIQQQQINVVWPQYIKSCEAYSQSHFWDTMYCMWPFLSKITSIFKDLFIFEIIFLHYLFWTPCTTVHTSLCCNECSICLAALICVLYSKCSTFYNNLCSKLYNLNLIDWLTISSKYSQISKEIHNNGQIRKKNMTNNLGLETGILESLNRIRTRINSKGKFHLKISTSRGWAKGSPRLCQLAWSYGSLTLSRGGPELTIHGGGGFNRIQISKFGIRFWLEKPKLVCTLSTPPTF